MAIRKARTDAQKERAKDKRLQSKYGITLADRNKLAEDQKHLCACCGNSLEKYGPPHVDHYHFKVIAVRYFDPITNSRNGWEAQGFNETRHVVCFRREKTKRAAIAAVKKIMMPWSVRAILCVKCNRGLGTIERFFDAAAHPENLRKVIEYLSARLRLPLTRF
jgi:Recombination endonuclease VII